VAELCTAIPSLTNIIMQGVSGITARTAREPLDLLRRLRVLGIVPVESVVGEVPNR
jgi:hypothetical protein